MIAEQPALASPFRAISSAYVAICESPALCHCGPWPRPPGPSLADVDHYQAAEQEINEALQALTGEYTILLSYRNNLAVTPLNALAILFTGSAALGEN